MPKIELFRILTKKCVSTYDYKKLLESKTRNLLQLQQKNLEIRHTYGQNATINSWYPGGCKLHIRYDGSD